MTNQNHTVWPASKVVCCLWRPSNYTFRVQETAKFYSKQILFAANRKILYNSNSERILTRLISSNASWIWESFSVGLNDVLLIQSTMQVISKLMLCTDYMDQSPRCRVVVQYVAGSTSNLQVASSIPGRSAVTQQPLTRRSHICLCSPSSINWYQPKTVTLCSWECNRGPGRKQWRPTAGYMTNVTCGCLPRKLEISTGNYCPLGNTIRDTHSMALQ